MNTDPKHQFLAFLTMPHVTSDHLNVIHPPQNVRHVTERQIILLFRYYTLAEHKLGNESFVAHL